MVTVNLFHHGKAHNSLLMPIDPQNVALLLDFKIKLVRCEPTTHFNVAGSYCTGNGILHDDDGRHHLERWTDAEWTEFRTNFVRIITRYWDDKFELKPNKAWYPIYRTSNASPGASEAVITCNLSLELVESTGKAHHRYYICKPKDKRFRSFADADDRVALLTHRDLAYDWTTKPTRVGRGRRHRVSFLQSTVLHEFGHTLGLDHVRGSGNDDANYGISLDERDDLMGLGDHLTAKHASPWRRQIGHHLAPTHHTHGDAKLRFTARVKAPQLITYWDNDWMTPAATP